jgi:hypothetical protein
MLGLEADLRAETAGLTLQIDGHSNVLTCRIDGAGNSVLETLRRVRPVLGLLRTIVPMLNRTGIRLDIVLGAVRLAQAGSGVQQNAAAWFLRLPSVRIGV